MMIAEPAGVEYARGQPPSIADVSTVAGAGACARTTSRAAGPNIATRAATAAGVRTRRLTPMALFLFWRRRRELLDQIAHGVLEDHAAFLVRFVDVDLPLRRAAPDDRLLGGRR